MNQGFTLVELLLSVTIIAVVAVISIPVYQSFQVKNDLDFIATTTTQSLRQAQMFSRAVASDSDWGVNVASGTLTLFKGSSYATRDTSFDETFEIPATITPSGTTEVVFTKFTGVPLTTGTLILTASTTETRSISINAKGVVD